MQGLGYKEIMEYLDQEISLEEAIYKLKRDTRHFAKRQLTWFRRERDVTWINTVSYTHLDVYKRQLGQICVPFSLIFGCLSLFGSYFGGFLSYFLYREERPKIILSQKRRQS